MAENREGIETHYRGYRFRSRLEARWAVFFDALVVKWEYEREGFDLGGVGRYLPDFWLPQVQMWAEIKPEAFSPEERDKCCALVTATGHPCLMLVGVPENKAYQALSPSAIGDGDDHWEYALTRKHLDEGRFFSSPEDSDFKYFEDTEAAVWDARSARFEYGEAGGPFTGLILRGYLWREMEARTEIVKGGFAPEDRQRVVSLLPLIAEFDNEAERSLATERYAVILGIPVDLARSAVEMQRTVGERARMVADHSRPQSAQSAH